MKGSNNRIY